MGYDTPVKSQDPTSISLLGVNIRNPNNTVPSTGTILTVSSGAAYMLPASFALDQISSLSNLSGQIIALNSNYSTLSSYVAGIGGGGGDISTLTSNFSTLSSYVNTLSPSSWSAYPAICTINAAGQALSSVSSVFVQQNLTVGPSQASGLYAVATGLTTTASGPYSHSEGRETTAAGANSHAEGYTAQAAGNTTHAEGFGTLAQGDYSHAEGLYTISYGAGSHVEGQSNVTNAHFSHAGGEQCTTNGFASFAHGYCNTTNNFAATALGCYTAANTVNALTLATTAIVDNLGSFIPGTAQTLFFTLSAQAIVSNTEKQLLYNANSNTITPWIRVNINSDGSTYTDYFSHTVTVDLTGYENIPVSGTSGNGIFFGSYRFYVYWDTSASPVAYIADRSGSKATSGGNVVLTPVDQTNMLSNGTAAVTVRAYMTSNIGFADYSITAQSTGYPLNWLAQVRVGELLAAK